MCAAKCNVAECLSWHSQGRRREILGCRVQMPLTNDVARRTETGLASTVIDFEIISEPFEPCRLSWRNSVRRVRYFRRFTAARLQAQ
jgi:hypothetical protein